MIKSYKDLISHYRVISLSENDLLLVQGSPEHRRYFLNQLLILFEPEYIAQIRKFKQILEQRNQLLEKHFVAPGKAIPDFLEEELKIWTKQLWETSTLIQKKRIAYLKELETEVNQLLQGYYSKELSISFTYTAKGKPSAADFEDFWANHKEKLPDELRWGRSLFGIHLDDFAITFQKKKARHFASRGQQKLVVFLIKIALALKLKNKHMHVSLLLDDFLTDFDKNRLECCLKLLSELSCQVFVTSPLNAFLSENYPLINDHMQVIRL